MVGKFSVVRFFKKEKSKPEASLPYFKFRYLHTFPEYKSLHTSRLAHQVGTYPDLCSIKRLGVLLLPPGWDASPSQGYPQH